MVISGVYIHYDEQICPTVIELMFKVLKNPQTSTLSMFGM